MNPLTVIVALLSVALFAQSLFSLYLMLYSWEYPERIEASRGPRSFLPPRLSFTVLLPARREEAVIRETIRRVVQANYPTHLLEVVVVCHSSDVETIAEAQRAINDLGTRRVRVETFADGPINKPRGLNVGFQRTSNEVVTVFDAEDDIDPDIFNVVNTVMMEEETGIVQSGVQLMNFRDHWFSVHNCLEYFFWFKSRLHFHAHVGMIPLGGNTVFIKRELIARVGGWDQNCLTEDADIGLKLSALGEPIRVVYDAQHVTREETPSNLAQFIRQRTRWNQGFMQILGKGTWRALPRRGQRLLALYTLSYPILQALLMLVWPLTIVALLWLKLPVPVVMLAFLPLYALGFQYLVTAVGAYRFSREYKLRFPVLMPVGMAITFLPFQWLLGISAVRAALRELRNQNNWEKTAHIGAHRRTVAGLGALNASYERLLSEAGAHLGTERGSVMVVDPAAKTLSIQASRGLPDHVVKSTRVKVGQGIAGWVAQTRRPAIVPGHDLPAQIDKRLAQPHLRSSIVLPIERHGTTIAVVSISSALVDLGDDAVHWLSERIERLTEDMRPSVPASLEAVSSV